MLINYIFILFYEKLLLNFPQAFVPYLVTFLIEKKINTTLCLQCKLTRKLKSRWHPQLPLSLMKTAQNHPMLVELKNGETYNGHLISCDNWMNINLKDVICTSRVSVTCWCMLWQRQLLVLFHCYVKFYSTNGPAVNVDSYLYKRLCYSCLCVRWRLGVQFQVLVYLTALCGWTLNF